AARGCRRSTADAPGSSASPSTPGAKHLATGHADGTVKTWSLDDRREVFSVKGHESEVLTVAYSPDGKRLASVNAHASTKVWDAASGQQTLAHQANQFAFSPDGKQLALAGGYGKPIKLWDFAADQETATLPWNAEVAYSLAFSPDGQRLAAA